MPPKHRGYLDKDATVIAQKMGELRKAGMTSWEQDALSKNAK